MVHILVISACNFYNLNAKRIFFLANAKTIILQIAILLSFVSYNSK